LNVKIIKATHNKDIVVNGIMRISMLTAFQKVENLTWVLG